MVSLPIKLKELLNGIEKDFVEAALEQTGGHRDSAAKLLGVGRTNLIFKIKKYGLEERYPSAPARKPEQVCNHCGNIQ